MNGCPCGDDWDGCLCPDENGRPLCCDPTGIEDEPPSTNGPYSRSSATGRAWPYGHPGQLREEATAS